MADNPSILHIDDDWKKQAQEEKQRLADAEAAKKAAAASPAAVTSAPNAASATPGRSRRGRAEALEPSFQALVQTLMTQALFYMGEIGTRSGQTVVDLDLARLQIDLLGVLEEKSRGNLTPDETAHLDSALYETRMRFISASREYVELGQR
jgi:3-oxoacyl-ACP reductase-like protein